MPEPLVYRRILARGCDVSAGSRVIGRSRGPAGGRPRALCFGRCSIDGIWESHGSGLGGGRELCCHRRHGSLASRARSVQGQSGFRAGVPPVFGLPAAGNEVDVDGDDRRACRAFEVNASTQGACAGGVDRDVQAAGGLVHQDPVVRGPGQAGAGDGRAEQMHRLVRWRCQMVDLPGCSSRPGTRRTVTRPVVSCWAATWAWARLRCRHGCGRWLGRSGLGWWYI